MKAMQQDALIYGQCMCGAVKIKAQRAKPVIRACHCEMCRQWTSSMFMSIPSIPESINVTGPAKSFRSSKWAERAFCETCGSALWYMTTHDQHRNLAAGLFPDAAGNAMATEYFCDLKPQGYALAGDHTRLTAEETTAMFTPVDKDISQ